MQATRTALALAGLVLASGAFAQSTSTTMDMGGGMTHVDTMGPNGAMSSSNCMSMGGGMTSCQTMDMSQPQRTYPTPDMSRPQTGGTARQSDAADDATPTFDPNQPFTTEPAATSARQSAAAFDLSCEGTETRITRAGMQEVAFSPTFRLDLASGRYCDGDCTSTRPIFRVEDTKITFFDSYNQSGRGGEQSVNRENGELFEGHIGVDATTMASARCERRPFSGFPQRQF